MQSVWLNVRSHILSIVSFLIACLMIYLAEEQGNYNHRRNEPIIDTSKKSPTPTYFRSLPANIPSNSVKALSTSKAKPKTLTHRIGYDRRSVFKPTHQQ